ncbi:Uncharacterized protein FWK35_00016350, partial [Aphis craccivora]
VFAAITKSLHLSRSYTISLQSCIPRSSKSFSTTSISSEDDPWSSPFWF